MDTSETRSAAGLQVVVGRQPIVEFDGQIVAYELLYRPAATAQEAGTDLDSELMTVSVLLGALTIGVDRLVGNKMVFCNAERGVLLGQTPLTLPPQQTIIEVLETVAVDDEVIAGCRARIHEGYTIALDDFVWREGAERLLELADIVKLDLLALGRQEFLALVARCRPYGVRLLAEKCETRDDVIWAHQVGCELFQGYAIERPEVVQGVTIAPSLLSHVQLAAALLQGEFDFIELELLLRREPGLVVQLLHMSSVGADLGTRRQVRSVREALVLMGTKKLRRWSALTLLGQHARTQSDALTTALVRARMCELLAPAEGIDPAFAFTAGLLSTMDLLLGIELDQANRLLSLDDDLVAAAFHREDRLGVLIDSVEGYQSGLNRGSRRPAHDERLDQVSAHAFMWARTQLGVLDQVAEASG